MEGGGSDVGEGEGSGGVDEGEGGGSGIGEWEGGGVVDDGEGGGSDVREAKWGLGGGLARVPVIIEHLCIVPLAVCNINETHTPDAYSANSKYLMLWHLHKLQYMQSFTHTTPS